jgi:hypothetical protein
MCNLYSITTNQAAIAALFRVMNQYEHHRRTDPRQGDAGDPHDAGGIRRLAARAVG